MAKNHPHSPTQTGGGGVPPLSRTPAIERNRLARSFGHAPLQPQPQFCFYEDAISWKITEKNLWINAQPLQNAFFSTLKDSFYGSSLEPFPTTKCFAGMFFLQSLQSI